MSEEYLLQPPHSDEAEQSVIGGLLLDNKAYDRIYDLVAEHDLYRADHREIWRTIVELIDRNKAADQITVSEALPEHAAYLGELALHTPSTANIRAYAQIVRDRSILRQLAGAATDIASQALERGADPQECAEQAEARILSILDGDAKDKNQEPVSIKQAVWDAVDWLEGERSAGIATGYGRLDAMFPGGGMQPEQFVVVAGRPGMGKSVLCWCVAEHAAKAGHHVAYFAMETSAREIGRRALAWHESLTDRTSATRYLGELPITIDATPAITLSHLRIRLRRLRRQKGLGLVVIDYVQLMRHRSENRLQEVSELSRGLKAVAKEFGVPVLAACQINRAAEGRADRRPILADLRESGQIEQDADAVIMLYRDEIYAPGSHLKGFGEALVRKMRDGPTGDVLLRFDGPRTRWIDYDGMAPQSPIEDRPQARVRQIRQDWSARD